MIPHPAAGLFPLFSEAKLFELADDIKANGQRLPIVVWNDQVVDGRNRLAACELIGKEPWLEERDFEDDAAVAAFVVSTNIQRRHLTPSQIAMLRARLLSMFGRGGDRRSPDFKTANAALKKATAGLNVSDDSTQRARKVLDSGDPALAAAVDSGKVAVSTAAQLATLPKEEQAALLAAADPRVVLKAAGQIRARKSAARLAQRLEAMCDRFQECAPLDSGARRYPVLLADPPWRYDFLESESRTVENHYPTMALDEIKALEVPAADDAILYLWSTVPKNAEAIEVMRAWGFEYRTGLVWIKDSIGMGKYVRGRHELLLVGVRGSFPLPAPEHRPDSVIEAPRTGHSEKPVEAYELIEKSYPDVPRLELFARAWRAGWDAWGNEVQPAVGESA